MTTRTWKGKLVEADFFISAQIARGRKCQLCETVIPRGQMARYAPETKEWAHSYCARRLGNSAAAPYQERRKPRVTRVAGSCAGCGGSIHVGDKVERHPATRTMYHPNCPTVTEAPSG